MLKGNKSWVFITVTWSFYLYFHLLARFFSSFCLALLSCFLPGVRNATNKLIQWPFSFSHQRNAKRSGADKYTPPLTIAVVKYITFHYCKVFKLYDAPKSTCSNFYHFTYTTQKFPRLTSENFKSYIFSDRGSRVESRGRRSKVAGRENDLREI